MQLAHQSRLRLSLPRFVIYIHLPVYVWFILSVLPGVIVVVLGVMLIDQLTEPSPNPFAPYSWLFHSDYDHLSSRREFNCQSDVFLSSNAPPTVIQQRTIENAPTTRLRVLFLRSLSVPSQAQMVSTSRYATMHSR